MNMQLVVQTATSSFPMQYSGNSFRMGRNADCDLTLRGCAVVSSHHARMDCDGRGWTLSDLASKNGTYLNGKRIQSPQPLKTGDTIHLGSNGPAVQIVDMKSPAGATVLAQPQAINQTVVAGPPLQAATVLHPQAMQPAIHVPMANFVQPMGHDGAQMQPAYQPAAPVSPLPSPTRLMLRQVLAGQKRSWVVNLVAGFLMLIVVGAASLCYVNNWYPFDNNKAANGPVAEKPSKQVSDEPTTPVKPTPKVEPKEEKTPVVNPPGQKPNTPKKLTEEQIFEHGLRFTCLISFQNNSLLGMSKNVIGGGTIFNVERRLIIVNHHIVQNAPQQFRVYFPKYQPNDEVYNQKKLYDDNGWFVMGKVIANDPSRDLAVVQVERLPESSKAVKFAAQSPKSGQSIHVVGPSRNGGAMWGYTDGDVRSIVKDRPQSHPNVHAKIIRSDVLAEQVLDGTAVLNNHGELVGVDFTHDQGIANRLHIDVTEVRQFLQSNGFMN